MIKHPFAKLLLAVTGAAAFMLTALPASAAETESSIARGGRLYDKWFAENKAAKPTTDHPGYIKDGKYGKDNSWRCKECHGWDYKGKDGLYAKGSHFTGVKGIQGAAGKDPAAIAAVLRDKNHGYTDAQLSAKDASDLALFVSKGQVDMAKYLDAANKAKGNGAKGEVYFNTLCAGCHGLDGKKVKDGPPLGSVADNGAEMLNKIANGQPGEAMPALRALDPQIAADIAVHLTTLPAK
ncbi:cytochrome c [Ideonella sp. A 288]|uniref:c-type cytochrome n=1 Tax=Ideonella sp. A 288 TaxID=1962181 RepID=UPI001303DFA2|nr:cytochrome c [Ideonella sp. A 288]